MFRFLTKPQIPSWWVWKTIIINRIGFVLAVQIQSGSKYITYVMTIVYKSLKDLLKYIRFKYFKNLFTLLCVLHIAIAALELFIIINWKLNLQWLSYVWLILFKSVGPATPINISLVETNSTTLRITWKPGDGGAEKYVVTVNCSCCKPFNHTETSNTTVITGLDPGSHCNISITAVSGQLHSLPLIFYNMKTEEKGKMSFPRRYSIWSFS